MRPSVAAVVSSSRLAVVTAFILLTVLPPVVPPAGAQVQIRGRWTPPFTFNDEMGSGSGGATHVALVRDSSGFNQSKVVYWHSKSNPRYWPWSASSTATNCS